MSDTPRTDAKEAESAHWHAHYGWKFARQIERENRELREVLREIMDKAEEWINMNLPDEVGDKARAALAKGGV